MTRIINKRVGMMLVILVAFCLIAASCSTILFTDNEIKQDTVELFAMDTYMKLTAYGDEATEALNDATREIIRLDDMFSIGNLEGEVASLNENGKCIVSEETISLLKTSLDIYSKTEGAFDITIYPLMVEWGFTTHNYKVPEDDVINSLLRNVGSDRIQYNEAECSVELPEGVEIDFGGIAKGYTSQRVIEIFKQHNLVGGIVSLGGNIQCYGKKPDGTSFNIGIKDPFGEQDYTGTMEIDNKAVITSGGYERYFEEDGNIYHHILDPDTGRPAKTSLKSVSVIASNGTEADALSTALFVMGKDRAIEFWRNNNNFDMVMVEEDGNVVITKGIEGIFKTELSFEVAE